MTARGVLRPFTTRHQLASTITAFCNEALNPLTMFGCGQRAHASLRIKGVAHFNLTKMMRHGFKQLRLPMFRNNDAC